MISEESIVAATKKRIDDYALEFTIQEAWRKMAQKRAERISREGTQDLSVLAYQLDEMKRNKSNNGFAAQQTARRGNLIRAKQQIKDMATLRRPSAATFYLSTTSSLFSSTPEACTGRTRELLSNLQDS